MIVASKRSRAGVLRDRVALMMLNSKLTWGLAWAGLAVVIAVPSLDFFTGKSASSASVLTSTTDPVKTGTVTTMVTPKGITIMPSGTASADPVGGYLKTNKALPDYISGASAEAAPTQVATIDPTPPAIAPTPFPARPPDMSGPATPERATPVATTAPMTTTPQTVEPASSPAPFVIDEPAAPAQQATVTEPAGPIPPEPIIDDAAQWHTKSLAQYLDQNGLLDDASHRSAANLTVVDRGDPAYDPNGFYLSDGPNNTRAQRRARLLEMLNDGGSGDNNGGGFSLF